MSTPAFTSTDAFRASSAVLRDRSAAGCALASAEISRRAATGKGGYVRESMRQGIKPAYWGTKAARSEGKALAYVRPKGPATSSKRDTIAAVRTEFDARLSRMEGALGDVIAAVSKTHEAVNALSARVSDRMAA